MDIFNTHEHFNSFTGDKGMFFRLAMLANVDKIDYIKIEDKVPEFTATMKFDKIIMNPPYNRNLHLKVLAEAIGHLTDDGECVNLSPIRWLQDPYRDFKNKNIDYFKFESSISKHISNLEFMNRDACNNVFGIALYCNLGIYSLNKKINDYNYQDIWKAFLNNEEVSIFNKISNFGHALDDVIEKNKKDGIRVMIAAIAGNRGALPIYKDIDFIVDGKKNGIDWTKCKNNGGYEKEEGTAPAQTIKFNSEYSAKNFYNSCKTTFYKFIANKYLLNQNIPLFWLPWLGDAVNPRTGKKGYTSEWTNEDFYKFFNITPEEQKLIEETMEKYK